MQGGHNNCFAFISSVARSMLSSVKLLHNLDLLYCYLFLYCHIQYVFGSYLWIIWTVTTLTFFDQTFGTWAAQDWVLWIKKTFFKKLMQISQLFPTLFTVGPTWSAFAVIISPLTRYWYFKDGVEWIMFFFIIIKQIIKHFLLEFLRSLQKMKKNQVYLCSSLCYDIRPDFWVWLCM